MKAQLIRVEHADPWYFTKYYYKCIDCGAEYTRHQCNERINPYCGKCQRKHETEAQKQRNINYRNKALDKINIQIDFEEKWLLDVYAKEYKVTPKDIEIAMNGIRGLISDLKGGAGCITK